MPGRSDPNRPHADRGDPLHDDVLRDAIEIGAALNTFIDDLRADLAASGMDILQLILGAERLVAAYDGNLRALRRTILTRDHLARRARSDDAIPATADARPTPTPASPTRAAPAGTRAPEAIETPEPGAAAPRERDRLEPLERPERDIDPELDLEVGLNAAPDTQATEAQLIRRRLEASFEHLRDRARRKLVPDAHPSGAQPIAVPEPAPRPEHAPAPLHHGQRPPIAPERLHHQAASPIRRA